MEPLKNDLNKWHGLLREGKATCYIKPTRFKHDSGYRCFEVGYCTPGKDCRIGEKLMLGQSSDHIHSDYMAELYNNKRLPPINMDLTVDGYIRIWPSSVGKQLKWDHDEWGMLSSAELCVLDVPYNAQPTTSMNDLTKI